MTVSSSVQRWAQPEGMPLRHPHLVTGRRAALTLGAWVAASMMVTSAEAAAAPLAVLAACVVFLLPLSSARHAWQFFVPLRVGEWAMRSMWSRRQIAGRVLLHHAIESLLHGAGATVLLTALRDRLPLGTLSLPSLAVISFLGPFGLRSLFCTAAHLATTVVLPHSIRSRPLLAPLAFVTGNLALAAVLWRAFGPLGPCAPSLPLAAFAGYCMANSESPRATSRVSGHRNARSFAAERRFATFRLWWSGTNLDLRLVLYSASLVLVLFMVDGLLGLLGTRLLPSAEDEAGPFGLWMALPIFLLAVPITLVIAHQWSFEGPQLEFFAARGRPIGQLIRLQVLPGAVCALLVVAVCQALLFRVTWLRPAYPNLGDLPHLTQSAELLSTGVSLALVTLVLAAIQVPRPLRLPAWPFVVLSAADLLLFRNWMMTRIDWGEQEAAWSLAAISLAEIAVLGGFFVHAFRATFAEARLRERLLDPTYVVRRRGPSP